jgi:hypothetical protein
MEPRLAAPFFATGFLGRPNAKVGAFATVFFGAGAATLCFVFAEIVAMFAIYYPGNG